MPNLKTNILDCTLRDGGYYNSWNFSNNLLKKYFLAIEHSSVSHVELGFRFVDKSNGLGSFAYTSEDFIDQLDLPTNKLYGLMINAQDYLKLKDPVNELKKSFKEAHNSKISFVRIAVDLPSASECIFIAKTLDTLGYSVMINLMQANLYPEKQLTQAIKHIKKWDSVDVLYFADSLGSMLLKDVHALIKLIKKTWHRDIGFHAHNNMHLALSNAIGASEAGCKFCDSTFFGMGRGAGNAQTESLLLETGGDYENAKMQLALKSFETLKKKYNWGPNSMYHFAAKHKIHPTYIQRLIADKRYSSDYVVKTLNYLKDTKSSSFNEEMLSKFTYFSDLHHKGTWNASNYLKGKSVLLIGSGPSVQRSSKKIELFIRKHSPFVITLNINQHLNQAYIDSIIASNINRILLDLELYKTLKCHVILPKACFSNLVKEKVSENFILDYGLSIKENSFKSSSKGCTSEWQEVTAYALLFLLQASPKKLFLAGFDGYSKDDTRHNMLNIIFHKYLSAKNSVEPLSLTASNHEFLKIYKFER